MCDDEIPVLTETFFVHNESCVFTFDGSILQWQDNVVHDSNIVWVDYEHSGNCCPGKAAALILPSPVHECHGHDTIIVRYAEGRENNRMRLNCVKIQGDIKPVNTWLRVLKSALSKYRRPRKYLVFINPFSGRQNGVCLYSKKVKPIFDYAHIETCVIVTQNRGDFSKVISSGVDRYDAILAVGGDGTVSEIVNCLISSQSSEVEDMSVPIISIPLGIIPCGSMDCLAFSLNGTRDIETHALYAVLGDQSRLDVCRAISENGLKRFFLSVFTYGYLSDLIRESEKFRWMGPMRYNYAGLLTLMRYKEYYGQLDLTGVLYRRRCSVSESPSARLAKKPKSVSFCSLPILPTIEPGECLKLKCERQRSEKAVKTEVLDVNVPGGNDLQEKREEFAIKGRYFLLACANISCASELVPNGIAPNCVPGDGNMNVILFQPNSIYDLYKIYARLTSKDRTFLLSDLPFVTVYTTKQVKINVTQIDADESISANCDGELFHDSMVDIRLYEGVIKFFTRRQVCVTQT